MITVITNDLKSLENEQDYGASHHHHNGPRAHDGDGYLEEGATVAISDILVRHGQVLNLFYYPGFEPFDEQ